MDYSSSLDYLYSLQHFGIKLGLENTRRLLQRIGDPQRDLPIVHIAGTNGKGSTAAALEQLLRSVGGQRTGLYTSPHLHSFTERIRIDGRPITESEVVGQTEAIRSVADGLKPTFFEFTTAMALRVFAGAGVERAILETGLGGRLDSTNVVEPELCVITPIASDHSEHLGTNLAQIAGEKGGIIKPGTPVISASQTPEVLKVLRTIAAERGAPFYLAGEDFGWSACEAGFDYRGIKSRIDAITPGLHGTYQHENLTLALAAAELIGLDLSAASAVRDALLSLRWPGRLEWCGDLLLDGAHNPHAATALAAYLEELGLNDLLWVAAVKSDKDVAGILAPLLPHTGRLLVAPLAAETSCRAETMLQLAAAKGVSGESLPDTATALQRALQLQRPGQKILVAGSLFLLGEVRQRCLGLAGAA